MRKCNCLKVLILFFFCMLLGGCSEKVNTNVEMSFLACGDADVTVIQDQDHVILIDTGESVCRDSVISYLQKKRIQSIDLMVLTHPDKDHIGNAVSIMKKWDVKEIVASSYRKGSSIESELFDYVSENQVDYEVLKEEMRVKIGRMDVLVKPPLIEYDSSNNSSLATWVTVDRITTFFGADMKKKRIEELLRGDILKSDIVKLPYHGRYISNMKLLLERLDPKFVVITSNKKDEKTISMLDVPYELTTKNVVFEIDGKTFKRKR